MKALRNQPTEPRCSITADKHGVREPFRETGDATRSELAEAFVEKTREFAARVEDEHQSPLWECRWEFPEVERRAREYTCRREAWAKALDLLWAFSDGETVDADALREALVRQSLRRYHSAEDARKSGKAYWRHISAEETEFCRAASLVEELAGLEDMTDDRRDTIYEEYRRNRA